MAIFVLSSCSSVGVESRGEGYYMVTCEEDIDNCFEMARRACESPFEVRTRYKDPQTGILETYIKCQR